MRYILNYLLLNVLCPLIPHPKLRALYLRFLGAGIGKNVRIEKVTFIQVQNPVSNLQCSDHSFIGSGVILDLSAPTVLEEYAEIAPGCTVLTHQDFGDFNGNPIRAIYKSKYAGVRLHGNAVVGADSTVLAGSSIGRSSVVAAKSLVAGNVPENVLVAGIPAKIIKDHGCLIPIERISREGQAV